MKNLAKLMAIILSSVLLVVGCSAKKPSAVVMEHLDYLTTMQDPEDYEDAFDEAIDLYLANLSNIDVLSEEISDDKTSAYVEVSLTAPSFVDIVTKTMGNTLLKGFSTLFTGNDISDDEIAEIFIENINNVQLEDRTGYINLTKIDKKWEIEEDDDLFFIMYGIEDMSELEEFSDLF